VKEAARLLCWGRRDCGVAWGRVDRRARQFWGGGVGTSPAEWSGHSKPLPPRRVWAAGPVNVELFDFGRSISRVLRCADTGAHCIAVTVEALAHLSDEGVRNTPGRKTPSSSSWS